MYAFTFFQHKHSILRMNIIDEKIMKLPLKNTTFQFIKSIINIIFFYNSFITLGKNIFDG